MRRYSRVEAASLTGASLEVLGDLEDRGLVMPYRRRRFFGALGQGEEYYTESQLEVLRWLLKVRRALEASRS
jgi:hypothetical protein